MPRPRRALVSVADTPYYHVFSRCVRRAFLCGIDHLSGKSYEHRRGWIEDRLRVLASLFSIEICAYAVMSNHYHLVVKLVPKEADNWSDDEVFSRWTTLFKGPLLVQRCCSGGELEPAEKVTLRSIAAVYGFYPDIADAFEKADNGRGGASCRQRHPFLRSTLT